MRAARAFLAAMCMLGPAAGHADMIDTGALPPYEICALCHGLDGNSAMAKFPKLAGQPKLYLQKQIEDFRAGHRSNDGGQMAAIVTEISEADIPVAAEWFAGQPAPAPAEPTERHGRGAALFERLGCAACHSGGKAQSPLFPYLQAQHAGYLAKQMADFRNGRRRNDMGREMQKRMSQLSSDEIAALADYLAATPRSEAP